jgi:catechol O-methyltransferase
MMPTFDETKAYAAQEDTFFDDGREIELLHFIYNKPDIDAIRGNPQRVLAAIDEFARTKKYLMNVGEDKGRIVTDVIKEVKPKVMVELGGYIGYSCILFASTVAASSPGARYFTLERNPEFGAIISSLVDLAGLSSTVTVVIGPSDKSIQRLADSGAFHGKIDMMFLDHYKPAYTTDLKLAEELRLIQPGTVLCADNVIKPGNPPYLEYVRSSTSQKRQAAQDAASAGGNEGTDGHIGVDARFAERSANQYNKREGLAKLDTTRVGNPDLVYESKLVNSWEPTGVPDGVEITRCVGVEQTS